MSSTLRAQLSLLKVQFRQGFQLILHGFAAMPGKHGDDSNLPPAGCLQPLHGDMMIVDGDIGFLLHRLSFFYCLLSLPARRLLGSLPEGSGRALPGAEERRTVRHRANGRVFTNGFELLNRFRQCCRERFSVFSDTHSLPLPKKQRGEYPGIKSSCKSFKVKGVQ